MVYRIKIAKVAQNDLEDIRVVDEDAADTIYAFLVEAKGSQDILDSLSAHDFGPDRDMDRYHVGVWVEQQQQGRNVWKLKLWELENLGARYRVIYAFDSLNQTYYILGVFPREFDYDPNDERSQRVVRSYESLAIRTP